MRKVLLLGGGVVLLIAALTACSDGLSPVDDDPLADRAEWTVSGITRIENDDPPPDWIARQVSVGLRKVIMSPGNYLETDVSDAGTGYYEFGLDSYDDNTFVVDGWYENATTKWFGTSGSFTWDDENPESFTRNVYLDIE